MKDVIRVGLAGFGLSGKVFHAPFVHADKRFCLKKVYERTQSNAQKEYPDIQTVRSFEALLTDDIDLVIVSLPNAQHYACAKAAIEAGKHVVVEKPAAATAEEVLELQALAKARVVVYTAYQNRRLDSDFLAVKNLLADERLGRLLDYHVNWDRYATGAPRSQWKASGIENDVLYDLGVHLIDQVYVLFGMPREVYADIRKLRAQSGENDNFYVVLYYDTLRVEVSSGESVVKPAPRFLLNWEKGTFVKYGLDVQEKALISGLRPPMENWGMEDEKDLGTLYTPCENGIKEETIPSPAGNYAGYYDNLYRAITQGAELLVKPEAAAAVLRIIAAARVSNETKQRVAL